MDPTASIAPRLSPPLGVLGVLRNHTFRSLRHRNYRFYFFGQIVSFTGSWMQSAALMWLVFDETSDPLWPPLLLVAQVGPTLLLGPVGGALADRFPKRSLIIATQASFLASAIVLTGLVAANFVHPWVLLAVMAINGVIQSVDLPARLSFVPDLVPREDLINAVSLNSLLFNSARAVGPALAGGLFVLADVVLAAGFLPGSRAVTLGAIWCFTFNVLSYAAVLGALRAIRGSERTSTLKSGGSVLAGFRYVIAHPRLGATLLLTGCVSVFAWPALSLFPAYTKLALGHAEKEYSVLVSSLGAGALVAALTTATFGTVARRGWFQTAGAGLAAVGLGGLALATNLPLAVLAASGLGFGLILYLSTSQSAMQLGVSDDSRGRVMALWAMTLSASAPLGHLLAGLAATTWPIRAVVAGLALGAAVATLGVGLIAFGQENRRQRPPERPASETPT